MRGSVYSSCLLAAVAAMTLAPPLFAADLSTVEPPAQSGPLGPADSARPADPVQAASAEAETLKLGRDASRRLTLAVMINGKGPYAFLVDTGADRTTISRELARTLDLPAGPSVLVHATTGVDPEPTVTIDRMDIGGRTVRGLKAPALAAKDLGADGMLGVDALHNLHLVMDFKQMQMSSSESRAEEIDPRTIVVQGLNRYGQLVLTQSKIHGVPILVVVDSGSQLSIGNPALMRLLVRNTGAASRRTAQIVSVTGRQMTLALEDISEADVGGVTIRNMPMGFAQLHIFDRFGLTKQPAMLLGMDVLQQCRKVTVDLRRREATFTLY